MTSGTAPQRLTPKGQATRDRIVAAAAKLMFEQGVAGTSTEHVIKAAGVSSPSQLYHYFRDKKSLVQGVIAYQTANILGFQRPLLASLDSFEALEAWRDVVVGSQRAGGCRGGCPIGSLSSELSDHDPEARAGVVACYDQWSDAIRDGLRAMRTRGELRGDTDADSLGLALLTALQGGLLMTQAHRDTIALETVLNAMIDHIRHHAAT